MKAWLLTGAHQPLQLVERETPHPGAGQVLIEVRAAGLCGSDVHRMHGKGSHLLAHLPIVLGHEIAGVVSEIGTGVTGCEVGDRVVVSPNETYAPGYHVDGGYATHCLVAESCLRPLPANVPFQQGAAATDAGQTSYGAVMRSGELKPGQRVGIIGMGGLGTTATRIALVNGAAEVYAAEPRREVWAMARHLGVSDIFADAAEMAGLKLDLIIDFAGYGVTTSAAIEAVRDGGIVVQIAAAHAEATLPVGRLVQKAVTLRGSHGGSPGDTEAVLMHMQKGELEILATSIGFEEIPAGLDRLDKGAVTGRLVAELPGA